MKITLAVRNQGHVPSFKNKKRSNKSGNVYTEPKTKRWMDACIQSFESQLFCISRINDSATSTVPHLRSLIVSSLPLDDSRQWIPELHVYCEEVDKGEEGAVIIIEKL